MSGINEVANGKLCTKQYTYSQIVKWR